MLTARVGRPVLIEPEQLEPSVAVEVGRRVHAEAARPSDSGVNDPPGPRAGRAQPAGPATIRSVRRVVVQIGGQQPRDARLQPAGGSTRAIGRRATCASRGLRDSAGDRSVACQDEQIEDGVAVLAPRPRSRRHVR